ncbi:protein hook, partial [Striga asiatica]
MAKGKRKAKYRKLVLEISDDRPSAGEDSDSGESFVGQGISKLKEELVEDNPMEDNFTKPAAESSKVLGLAVANRELSNNNNIVDDLVYMGFDVEMLEDKVNDNAPEKKKTKVIKEKETNESTNDENACPLVTVSSSATGSTMPEGENKPEESTEEGFQRVEKRNKIHTRSCSTINNPQLEQTM